MARLTDKEVLQIRALAKSGKPYSHMARKFGKSAASISQIVCGRMYGHLKEGILSPQSHAEAGRKAAAQRAKNVINKSN